MTRLASILSLCALISFTASALAQTRQHCPDRRTISVSATGTATADADLAVIHVGYRVYGPDAAAAYAAASQTSNAIMKALLAFGVEKNAIESTSQSLQQTQPYEVQQYPAGSRERRDHAFHVAQGWTIRVKPADAAAALNAAINAGANDSGSIDWEMRDENALEAKAAAQAAIHARAIAEQIAASMNVHITQLQSLQENQPGGPILMRSNIAMAGLARPKQEAQPLAISSRRIQASITVSAVFAIQ